MAKIDAENNFFDKGRDIQIATTARVVPILDCEFVYSFAHG